RLKIEPGFCFCLTLLTLTCVMGRLLIWKSTPKNSTCFTDKAKTVPLGKHNLAVPFSFAG
ncbi:hypothetical protein, partial [Ruthenibacterium lactatiformans]|uniref:hypothetical protein n=1 Tax=Ruthenibacterium lactatiformans TaxID=1550024 RepID=UPI00266D7FDD